MRISTEQISPLQLFQNPPFAIAVCTAEITFLRLNFFTSFYPCFDALGPFQHILCSLSFWDDRDYFIVCVVTWILCCIRHSGDLRVYHVWQDLHFSSPCFLCLRSIDCWYQTNSKSRQRI